jgi:hypothetical protein
MQYAEIFNVTGGGTYSYHCALNQSQSVLLYCEYIAKWQFIVENSFLVLKLDWNIILIVIVIVVIFLLVDTVIISGILSELILWKVFSDSFWLRFFTVPPSTTRKIPANLLHNHHPIIQHNIIWSTEGINL